MIKKRIVLGFTVGLVILLTTAIIANVDNLTLGFFVLILGVIIFYPLYPRLKLRQSMDSTDGEMVSIDGRIVSNETIESPFIGEQCVAYTWKIYERANNISSRSNRKWLTIGTGINFPKNLRIESNGQEYEIAFEDVAKSKPPRFLRTPRIGSRPLAGKSGVRLFGTSAEFSNGDSTTVGADENPTERIENFVSRLGMDVGPTDKKSLLGTTIGSRRYSESCLWRDSDVFIRGKEKQGDEYGVKKIVPSKDKICIISDRTKKEYKRSLDSSIGVLSGLVLSCLAWFVISLATFFSVPF